MKIYHKTMEYQNNDIYLLGSRIFNRKKVDTVEDHRSSNSNDNGCIKSFITRKHLVFTVEQPV